MSVSIDRLASVGVIFPDVLDSPCSLQRAVFWSMMFDDLRRDDALFIDRLTFGGYVSQEQMNLAIRWRKRSY